MLPTPEGDTQKRLRQAAGHAQSLGGVMLLLACCSIPSLLMPQVAGGAGRSSSVFEMLAIALPAVSLLVFSHYLRRGHYWAVIACLVVGSLAATFSLVMMGFTFLMMTAQTKSIVAAIVFVPLAIFGLLVIGFCRLIY